jgi:hypothetical protein
MAQKKENKKTIKEKLKGKLKPRDLKPKKDPKGATVGGGGGTRPLGGH